MAIDEKLLKSVIAEVLKEMNTADTSAASAVEGETYAVSYTHLITILFSLKG